MAHEYGIPQMKGYFALDEANRCASTLLNKAKSFQDLMQSNAYLNKLRNMWYFYHGMFNQNSHEVSYSGEQGELLTLNVNHFRNIGEHIKNMLLANRPIMEARAVNTDYKSLAQTYLANGILDYYMREKGMEDVIKKAVEYAIVLGSGFVRMEWNATAGEEYDVADDGSIIREGEVEFSNLSPLDVIVDGTKESWDNDWIMIRTFKNRYNLMAKYPEFAEKIAGLQPKNYNSIYKLSIFSNDDTDDIPVYEFYHKRTEAMPDGRYMLFLHDDIVLLDTKMPYRRIPIFRIVPAEFLGTVYGYSPLFDLYPIQEAINAMYGTILTNQSAFGVQNVFIKTGSDITVSEIQGGMNFIEGSEPPVPINLTQTPAEIFNFIKMLEGAQETISGVSSVTRGNPEASLKSGTALALVQSMSLQFISNFQQSYVRLIESIGTSLIEMLKDFASAPKVIAVVGKHNKSLLKEFTGEDLNAINRVVVDVGNPLSRTIAGRVQMAEQLAQMKLLKDANQYFQVMATGKLDVVFEGEISQQFLMRSENESLMEGKPVRAIFTDKHREHIMEHSSVLADPELRQDNTLVDIVMTHIQEHIDLLRNTDPDTLQILLQQPLAPQPDPTLPPGPMNNASVVQQSPNGEVLGMPNQGQDAMNNMEGQMQLPETPQVDASLLQNPAIQEQVMNNLK